MADESTALTPLGELLERARGRMSKRAAAKAAGISEGRWRQIVTGQQKVGGGIVLPANPRRATVIAMANAVGASVDQALTAAGMERQSQPRTPTWQESEEPDDRRLELVERIAAASRELAAAAEELAVIEGSSSRSRGATATLQVAAYAPGDPSELERLKADQDEAAEAPDAPGTEDSA